MAETNNMVYVKSNSHYWVRLQHLLNYLTYTNDDRDELLFHLRTGLINSRNNGYELCNIRKIQSTVGMKIVALENERDAITGDGLGAYLARATKQHDIELLQEFITMLEDGERM